MHQWLAVLLPVQGLASMFVTYKIALDHQHVDAFWPFISETGAYYPEKSLFTLLLYFSGILAGLNVYIRYHTVNMFLKCNVVKRRWKYLNIATAAVGVLMSIGFSIVASYSYIDDFTVHMVGAGMAFLMGFVYLVLQTVLSGKSVRQMAGTHMCIFVFRIILCVCMFVSLIIHIHYGLELPSTYSGNEDRWKKTASALGEWIAGGALVTYFGTFFSEFKHVRLSSPALIPTFVGAELNENISHSSSSTRNDFVNELFENA